MSVPGVMLSGPLLGGTIGKGKDLLTTPDYRHNMNMYALTKERGTDLVNMTRLLGDTLTQEWQKALKKLLMSYYQHDVMKQAVSFLSDNIHRAIESMKNPDLFPGFPCLYIHTELKPIIFDIDMWKTILIALNFEITEPEGNRHLDLIEVKVTDKVTVPSLMGFHILLSNIAKLSWVNIRLVLYMQEKEELPFLYTLQELMRCPERLKTPTLVESLYERQTTAMESLGFQKRRVAARSSKTEVVWERTNTDQIDYVEVVLFGLFHDGKGLETYI